MTVIDSPRAIRVKTSTGWADLVIQGPTGAQGAQGIQGIQGIQGPNGTPGEKWFSGTGVPAGSTGIVGDWYLNDANGDIYEKTGASAWTLRDNITGPQGPQGIQGIQGIQGNTGATGQAEAWLSTTAAPAGNTGNVGDWHLNTTTGDVSEKTSGNTWTLRGNIKGPQGIQGIQGVQGPTGNTGSTGSQGPAGTPGEKWFTGAGAPAGATGIVGDWHLDSANGDYYEKTGASAWTLRGNLKGPQGIQGATGATGSQGPQGVKGDTGATGSQGPQGVKGDTGLTGSQGPQGVKGDTGNTGPTGATGSQGPTGATGSQGPAGVGVPVGGTVGQSLVKKSGTDYDTQWQMAAGGGVDYIGNYSAAIAYKKGDVVRYNGNDYLAVNDSTGSTPPAPGSAIPAVSIGTSLPTSPFDGQEAILVDSLTAPTYSWRFRYTPSIIGANKWIFVGGAPQVLIGGGGTLPGGSYQNFAAPTPLTTVIRAGLYSFRYGATVYGTVSSVSLLVSVYKGTTSSDADAARVENFGASLPMALSRESVGQLAAGATVATQGKAASGNLIAYYSYLTITPIAVA